MFVNLDLHVCFRKILLFVQLIHVRQFRGGSTISGKGVHMYKGVGFVLLIISNFSYIFHENEIILSLLS